MSLPTSVAAGQTGHISHHNTLHKAHNVAENVVADYGAVGNGSNDDTAAIQNALNAAITNKTGEVVFPGGKTYKITSTLTWPAGVMLTGLGRGKWSNPRATPEIIWGGAAGGTMLAVQFINDNSYQTCMRELGLNGNFTAAHGIVFADEMDSGAFLIGGGISRFTSHALRLDRGATNAYIGGGIRFDHVGGYAIRIDSYVNTHLLLSDVQWDCGLAPGSPLGFLQVLRNPTFNSGCMVTAIRIRTEINKQLGGNKALVEFVNDGSPPGLFKLNAVGWNVTSPSSTDDYAFFRPTVQNDSTFAISAVGSVLSTFNADVLRNVSRVPPHNKQNFHPLFVYAPSDIGDGQQSAIEGVLNVRDLEVGGSAAVKSSVGHGNGVIRLANAISAPSSNPTNTGVLYVEGGALKYRGPNGTVTTLGNA